MANSTQVETPSIRKQVVRIFISYSRKDGEYVDALSTHLRTLNTDKPIVEDFIDRRDMDLNDLWRDRIKSEIMLSDIFILFVSSDAFASPFVKEELDTAIRKKNKEVDFAIIPFLVRDCTWKNTSIARYPAFPKDGKYVVDAPNKDKYYSELSEHIRQFALKNNKPNPIEPVPTEFPRPWSITEEILEKLEGIYYKIEKILSMKNEFWKENAPQNNDWNKSFGSIYFTKQVQIFSQIKQELESYSTSSGFFEDKLKNIIPQIEDSILGLQLLIEMSKGENLSLFQCLQQIETCIGSVKKKLLSRSNSTASNELKNILFPQLKGFIIQLISKMSDIDREFTRMMSS
jgi:hypothetical protein